MGATIASRPCPRLHVLREPALSSHPPTATEGGGKESSTPLRAPTNPRNPRGNQHHPAQHQRRRGENLRPEITPAAPFDQRAPDRRPRQDRQTDRAQPDRHPPARLLPGGGPGPGETRQAGGVQALHACAGEAVARGHDVQARGVRGGDPAQCEQGSQDGEGDEGVERAEAGVGEVGGDEAAEEVGGAGCDQAVERGSGGQVEGLLGVGGEEVDRDVEAPEGEEQAGHEEGEGGGGVWVGAQDARGRGGVVVGEIGGPA